MERRLIALALTLALTLALGMSAVSAENNGEERGAADEAAAVLSDAAGAAAEDAEPAALTDDTAGDTEADAANEAAEGAETAAAAGDALEEAAEPIAADETVTEETEETPAPDAAGTLSFANLAARMKENDYSMRAVQEQIDDIESHDYEFRSENLKQRIQEVSDAQWMAASAATAATSSLTPAAVMADPSLLITATSTASAATSASNAMESAYRQLRSQLDAVKRGDAQRDDETALRQYRNMQNLMVMAGELRYIAMKSVEASDAALTRKLGALDRGLAALRVSRGNGLVSELDTQKLEDSRVQLVSGQQTLRMNYETNLLQLKALVGAELGEPLVLGALPKVTAEQLAAMDLDADLQQAKDASYELFDARKQIDDFFKGTYSDVLGAYGTSEKVFEVSQVKHALQALRYNAESTEQTFELRFRTLYAQVKDYEQALGAAKSALALEEKNYAASALKCRQGTLSQNALADAADTLADAKDKVLGAELDLLTAYRSYQWAVGYGILNG